MQAVILLNTSLFYIRKTSPYGTETFVLDSGSESESRHTTPLMLENNTSWLKSQFSNSSSLKKGKRTMQHMNKSNIDVVSKEPILL